MDELLRDDCVNAELKSMNSNLTYVSVLSRCVRAGWEGSGDAIIGRAIGPTVRSINIGTSTQF